MRQPLIVCEHSFGEARNWVTSGPYLAVHRTAVVAGAAWFSLVQLVPRMVGNTCSVLSREATQQQPYYPAAAHVKVALVYSLGTTRWVQQAHGF